MVFVDMCLKRCNREVSVDEILNDNDKCNFCDVPYKLLEMNHGSRDIKRFIVPYRYEHSIVDIELGNSYSVSSKYDAMGLCRLLNQLDGKVRLLESELD